MGGSEILFETRTPLGFLVRVTRVRWELIVTVKHPVMAGRESSSSVKTALENPAKQELTRLGMDREY
jgi:hypothetical protein